MTDAPGVVETIVSPDITVVEVLVPGLGGSSQVIIDDREDELLFHVKDNYFTSDNGIFDDAIARTWVKLKASLKKATMKLPGDEILISESMVLNDYGIVSGSTTTYPHWSLSGHGVDISVIRLTGSGWNKRMVALNVDSGTKTNRGRVNLVDFTLIGLSSDTLDPIGIKKRWVSTSRWNVKVQGFRNTGIEIWEVDNSHIIREVIECGFQPQPKTNAGKIYYSMTSGDRTLVAYDPTTFLPIPGYFTAGLMGEPVFLQQGESSLAASDGLDEAMRFTVSVNGDGSSCEVDEEFTSTAPVPTADGTKYSLSWGRIRGSINVGTNPNLLVLKQNVLDAAAMLNCPVFIRGAGAGNGVLRTTMTAISGVNITLETAASFSVTDVEIWFGASFLIFPPETEAETSDITNDVTVEGRIENFRGPAEMWKFTQQGRLIHGKTHGLPFTSNNFAATSHSLVWSRCSRVMVLPSYEFDRAHFGNHPNRDLMSGWVLIQGARGHQRIEGMFQVIGDDIWPIEVDSIEVTATIRYGGIFSKPLNGPMVKRGPAVARSTIRALYPIQTIGFDEVRAFPADYAPMSMQIQDGEVRWIDPDATKFGIWVTSAEGRATEYFLFANVVTADSVLTVARGTLTEVATGNARNAVLANGVAGRLTFLFDTTGTVEPTSKTVAVINRVGSEVTFEAHKIGGAF